MAPPGPVKLEDDFMASLFADLDATTFDALPSSPVVRSQRAPSQSQNQRVQASPRLRAPLTPVKPNIRSIIRTDVKGKGKEVLPVVAQRPRAPTPKRVVVVKSEPEVKVDYDELCDGMDWDEEIDLSQAGPSRPRHVPLGQQYQRCEVLTVLERVSPISKRLVKELTVSIPDCDEARQVVLRDDWITTPVQVGDTVNLIGTFTDDSPPSLNINFSSGYIILHPDILVSSTKVADSSSCTRKALLQELIRTVGGSTPALVYGNMLHELMQACMTEGRWELEWREAKAKEIVGREVQTLWSIQLEVDKAVEMLMEKSKGLEAFKDVYIGSSPGPSAYLADAQVKDANRARLAVTETIDIEEDIWSPKYGLKGKVDVSIAGRLTEGPFTGDSQTLPFEIKTGRAIAGMEHRAQTMLYTLLMSDRYDEVIDSGLLYYSQTSDLFRVKANRNEIRGLLLARNEFATFLHRRMTLSNAEDSTTAELLPPPIDEARSCKRCYVASACMLYRKAVEGVESLCDDPDSADYPMQLQYEEEMGHLTIQQGDFFRSWERLISLEEQELVRFKKEIWTMTAEQRMKVGRCLANMSIDESYEPPVASAGAKIHRFTYRLQHASPLPSQATSTQRASRSLLGGTIAVNDPVVLSLESPSVLAISRGFVLAVSAHDITLGLDHSLTSIPQATKARPDLLPSAFVFRIDKDELAAGMGRIRDNLVQLFVAQGDERRRELVVDLKAPGFCHVASTAKLIPSNLNEDQHRAVEKVLAAKDYALILGMPGTGKTTTIAHVLKALAKAGKSVLLTSYTHSAVDNILLKVMDAHLSILRLGNRDKIMPCLHKYTLDPANPATTLAQLDKQLMEPQIVATTALAINEPIFTRRTFDVCIVDEASQVTLPTCLGPLRFAKTFILVGDHNQLPPLVRNRAAREGGLDVSLFKRLSDAHPDSVVYLSHQYRMNDEIMLLSNKLIYANKLVAGSETVAKQTLHLSTRGSFLEKHRKSHAAPCWLAEILRDERKVVFVDTDSLPARERRAGSLIDNEIEAKLVVQATEAFVECGVPESGIGVIALYRQQIKTISRQLEHLPSIEVLTADRSQGRDKDVIVMSLTRSNTDGQTGDLLKDWRRINVCITRAKSKLVFFGSRSTLAHVELLASFFEILEERGWIYRLLAGAHEAHDAGRGAMKRELSSSPSSAVKRMRRGPGALLLEQPLAQDILNSL